MIMSLKQKKIELKLMIKLNHNIVICTKRDRVKATHAQIMRVTKLDKYSRPSREINKRIVFISPAISLPLRL